MSLQAAIDDGSSYIKITTDGKKCFKYASLGRSGKASRISINGGQASELSYHNRDGDVYTIGSVSSPEPTDYPDYQFSKLNQALVMHALHLGQHKPQEVSAVFSLPFNQYFLNNGSQNERLIKRKKENVAGNTFAPVDSDVLFQFDKSRTGVVAEGLAAALNVCIELNDKNEPIIDQARLERPKVVIDIGGNTIDVCVMEGFDVDHGLSLSKQNSGVIEIQNQFISMLQETSGLSRYFDEGTPIKAVEHALFNDDHTLRIGNKAVQVHDQAKQSKNIVANSIKSTLRSKLGSGYKFEDIIFVGGGSKLMEKELADLFEGAHVESDPEYANVKGLYKFMRAGM